MLNSKVKKAAIRLPLLTAMMILAACGNDSNNNDNTPNQPDVPHQENNTTLGRLVITNNDTANPRAYVYDLDDQKLASELPLKSVPNAVYSSPDHRYAVLIARADNITKFVDGGIYQHDDHIDKDKPALLPLDLTGPTPNHYRSFNGQAAIFYDGSDSLTSSFDLLTDNSLKSGKVVAYQPLPQKHHGVAEPRGNYVLSSYLAAGETTLSKLALYELHNDHFHFEKQFATDCSKLHGAGSNQDYSAFGCEDGVLVVQQKNNEFSDYKIPVNVRITTIAGHSKLKQFVAFATGNLQAFVIDPVAKTSRELDWSAGIKDAEGKPVARLQHVMDQTGQHLVIMDNTGNLHVIETATWTHKASIKVLDKDVSLGKISLNASTNDILVSDATAKAIHVVSLRDLKISQKITLDFAPANFAWVGVKKA